MSICPTCGHGADDALVHSTPIAEPPAPFVDPWRADLAELIGLVRRAVLERQHASDRHLHSTRSTNGRKGRIAQLRKAS